MKNMKSLIGMCIILNEIWQNQKLIDGGGTIIESTSLQSISSFFYQFFGLNLKLMIIESCNGKLQNMLRLSVASEFKH